MGYCSAPYFDRTPQHFSGHVNTPSRSNPSGYDSGSQKGGFVYLAHPVFSAYKTIDAVAMPQIICRTIEHARHR
jgi:hypothetical protein